MSTKFDHNLKCSICHELLTCGPVFLKQNGDSICGRCPAPDDASRNLPFEKLAENILVPCKNVQRGCPVNLPFCQQKNHEDSCNFQLLLCPIYQPGNCEWSDTKTKLYQHCKDNHLDKILSNPFEIEYDVTKNSLDTYILTAYNVLFIVQTKISLSKQRILHSVYLIGDQLCSSHYSFTLEIINKEDKLIRKSMVKPLTYLDFQDDGCISVSINSIIDCLGSIYNTSFKITIENTNNNCITCQKCIHNNSSNCEYCSETRFCKFNYKSCAFKDTIRKTDKHEEFFCYFNNWCILCSDYVDIKLDHFVKHHKEITRKCKKKIEAHVNSYCEYIIIQSQFGVFVCSYAVDHSFYFEVYSQFASSELHKYNVELSLKHRNYNILIQKSLVPTYDKQYDWFTEIDKEEFDKVVDKNSRFYIYVNITD